MCMCVYIYIYLYIYRYVQLNHHAFHLKLTQYCKSTIFKPKKTIKESIYIHLEVLGCMECMSFNFFIEKFSIEIQLMYNIMFQVTT